MSLELEYDGMNYYFKYGEKIVGYFTPILTGEDLKNQGFGEREIAEILSEEKDILSFHIDEEVDDFSEIFRYIFSNYGKNKSDFNIFINNLDITLIYLFKYKTVSIVIDTDYPLIQVVMILSNLVEIMKEMYENFSLDFTDLKNTKILDSDTIYDLFKKSGIMWLFYLGLIPTSKNIKYEDLCNMIYSTKYDKDKILKIFGSKEWVYFDNIQNDRCIRLLKGEKIREHISMPQNLSHKYINEIAEKYGSCFGSALTIYIRRDGSNLLKEVEEEKIEEDIDIMDIDKSNFPYPFLNMRFPNIFYVDFKYLHGLHLFRECINSNENLIAVDLTISLDIIYKFLNKDSAKIKNFVSHANILLIDKERKEIERFEPQLEKISPDTEFDNNVDIDNALVSFFDKLGMSDYRYIPPFSYCVIGPQTKELKYAEDKYEGGYCGWWSLYYLQLRLEYREKSRYEISQWFNSQTPEHLYEIIKKYRNYILENNKIP